MLAIEKTLITGREVIMVQQTEDISIDDVIQKIVTLNEEIRRFWSRADGWAPNNAANLLNISRLDWQVLLSRCLNIWLKNSYVDEGSLILAWANLGSLVEGTLKLVLCIYYDDYQKDPDAFFKRDQRPLWFVTGKGKFIYRFRRKQKNSNKKSVKLGKSLDFFSRDERAEKNTKLKKPDVLEFEKLRQFLKKKQIIDELWSSWILHIQQRRNAIHAYQSKEIGDWKEFCLDVRKYLEFLQLINNNLPYPE